MVGILSVSLKWADAWEFFYCKEATNVLITSMLLILEKLQFCCPIEEKAEDLEET